jgi:hypothetical protein
MARKPGFLTDPNNHWSNLQNGAGKELTLALTPESLIVGSVALPTSEASDPITLEIFRRDVQDGRVHWIQAGSAQSTSDGQFRFADLQPGTYKLLTRELLDRDPLALDPFKPNQPDPDQVSSGADATDPLFGYPPVYYQNAADFGSASIIQLAAGQTQTVSLALVRQAYYRVKVPVIMPGEGQNGLNVSVYANGHKGPGFSLGYNNIHHAIEGLLPNGSYTIEASNWGSNSLTGTQTITVKGAPLNGPSMAVVPGGTIPVYVKEEFTSSDYHGTSTFSSNAGGRVSTWSTNGPRRYLTVTLDPADDFGTRQTLSLKNPTGPDDEALAIEGASAGSYWVRVHSSRGYAASVRSGNLDLLHRPLVVSAGGGAAPIEITMRDDTAEIDGTVEGITAPAPGPGGAPTGGSGGGPGGGAGTALGAHIYCVPLAESSGVFAQAWVHPDGTFSVPGVAPGTYRVLAFVGEAREFEYRNPEAMQAYESKGAVVRVAGGQKERVQLQLVSIDVAGSDQ